MMSGALKWMAILSGDKNKEEYSRERYEDERRDERYMDDRYDDDRDRYSEDDRRRKPYNERGGYQMRGRERGNRHDHDDEWEPKKLTKSGAEKWVRHMTNANGTTSEH